MALPPEIEAQILRLHHAERWPAGTIARQLGVHRQSVARVLAQAGLPSLNPHPRPLAIEPFLPFIVQTLTQYPQLCASRLYAMVQARGYPGRPDHFRHLIARYRPARPHEAYLRLRTLPGEQGQVDWGHFGHLQIGRARRALMAFVMVLSWSRQIFVHFYLGAHMENFLRGHRAAFEAWDGVPRCLLYDNLKSAVLERRGPVIRFNPTLLALAGHYRFEPRPVAPARGNEKGRVERAIRYIREAFFAGRRVTDLAALNAQALAWCTGAASARRCPEEPSMTVAEAFGREQPRLLALPADAFPSEEVRAVSVGKTPYVRFDLNDYSVPHDCVARSLTVTATLQTVRVLDGQTLVACHARSFDRGDQIEAPEHLEALLAHKRAARAHRSTDGLISRIPLARQFLTAATERGEPLARTARILTEWLHAYGAGALQSALEQALARGVAHPNAVRLALEQQRLATGAPPPLALALPAHLKGRDVSVAPHALDDYDRLMEHDDDEC